MVCILNHRRICRITPLIGIVCERMDAVLVEKHFGEENASNELGQTRDISSQTR